MSEVFAFQVAQEVPVEQWVADSTPKAAGAFPTFHPLPSGSAWLGTPFGDGFVEVPTDILNGG